MAADGAPLPVAREKGRQLEFFIFGSPVTMSPSPDIHTVGFAENGFPHSYARFDSLDLAAVMAQVRAETCGGGSVTIPHKEELLREMDELSDAARVIGAINTITKMADGTLHGDNTDWLGIKRQLESRLASPPEEGLTCLLCGAGGTARAAAYALRQMGASRVLIYNRTASRAEQLAEEFGYEVLADLDDLEGVDRLHIVVDTLPGSTEFSLPAAAEAILARCKPVVLEASYIPRRTVLVQQALATGCEVVEGVDMLFEQGCSQCEIWTGQPPPRQQIAAALLQALFAADSAHPAYAKMQPHNVLPVSLVMSAGSELRA